MKSHVLLFQHTGADIYDVETIISLKDSLLLMRCVSIEGEPVPFDLQFVKADRRRRMKGSDIIELKGAIIPRRRKRSVARNHMQKLEDIKSHKDPHHDVHQTINVYDPSRQRSTKIHVRLITSINNKRVVY